MRFTRPFLIAFAATLLLGLFFIGGYALGNYQKTDPSSGGAAFNVVWTVQNLLQQEFLGDVPSLQAQAYGAAHGLVSAFNDPYTVFVEPAPRELERDDLRGHFGGIGANMSRNEAGDLVLAPIRDRPAARAGVQDDDVLLAVDAKPITAEMTVEQVVVLVRGDEGSKVTLIAAPGRDAPSHSMW